MNVIVMIVVSKCLNKTRGDISPRYNNEPISCLSSFAHGTKHFFVDQLVKRSAEARRKVCLDL